jgi:hypothetical protein
MDRMAERVAGLETAMIYERRMTDQAIGQLNQRLTALEQRPASMDLAKALTTGGWLKIIVAICLPLLVLLATGDLSKAVQAGRLLAGPG